MKLLSYIVALLGAFLVPYRITELAMVSTSFLGAVAAMAVGAGAGILLGLLTHPEGRHG